MTAQPTARRRNRIQSDDVRAHIQQVALDLFIEEGYEKTSLREIASRLGVTKAALYYHFRTKDDIIGSLIAERVAVVEELLEWAQNQPDRAAMRIELISRYAESLRDDPRLAGILRFLKRNQTLVDTLDAGRQLGEQLRRLLVLLVDPAEPLPQQLRRAMALYCLHADVLPLPGTAGERHEAMLEVALELMASADAAGPGASIHRQPR